MVVFKVGWSLRRHWNSHLNEAHERERFAKKKKKPQAEGTASTNAQRQDCSNPFPGSAKKPAKLT